MEKLFKIGFNEDNGSYAEKDVNKLNDFLTHPNNDDFEIIKIKTMPNGEVFIIVSDYID